MKKSKPQRIQQFLLDHNLDITIVEFEHSTRTADEAAEAVGCEVGQIVKSLVFRSGEKPVLFLVSGANRVNPELLGPIFPNGLKMADADFTREKTGYAIGGVPPVAHEAPLDTYLDETLLDFEMVWAAAGTPHAVFPIKSQDLLRLTSAKAIKVN
jgi:prolyl-tRNA editing enzyme YbaK/EbsC (Cys-tRNA(Pro) deacylase)